MVAPALAVRRAVMAHLLAGALVAFVVAIVALLVGLGLGWAALVGVVVGGAAAAWVYSRQEAIVLRAMKASPIGEGDEPRLENLVGGLCVANGFRQPSLYLIDDAAPNMFVVGRHPRHGAMAVTTGLLDRLGRVELEGLIAQQLTGVRNRTTLIESTVGVLIARPLGFAPGLARSLATRLLDPRTSAETDVASVGLTRYPPGLAAALRSLDRDARDPVANPAAFRHLWVDPPDGAIAPHAFSLTDRVAVLEEL